MQKNAQPFKMHSLLMKFNFNRIHLTKILMAVQGKGQLVSKANFEVFI